MVIEEPEGKKRRRRRRKRRKDDPDRMGFAALLPQLLTTANLAAGFFAIVKAFTIAKNPAARFAVVKSCGKSAANPIRSGSSLRRLRRRLRRFLPSGSSITIEHRPPFVLCQLDEVARTAEWRKNNSTRRGQGPRLVESVPVYELQAGG